MGGKRQILASSTYGPRDVVHLFPSAISDREQSDADVNFSLKKKQIHVIVPTLYTSFHHRSFYHTDCLSTFASILVH